MANDPLAERSEQVTEYIGRIGRAHSDYVTSDKPDKETTLDSVLQTIAKEAVGNGLGYALKLRLFEVADLANKMKGMIDAAQQELNEADQAPAGEVDPADGEIHTLDHETPPPRPGGPRGDGGRLA